MKVEKTSGYKFSRKSREKMRKAHLGKCHLEKTKRKISETVKGKNNPFYGKHHSRKTKQKISKKLSGRILSKKTKKKIGRANMGRYFSIETRLKISNALKGRISPLRGRPRSKEAILKMKKAPKRHHVYLKENSSKVILVTTRKHSELHHKVYEYIYEKFGKKGIDNYLKWFDKKYGLETI